MTQPSNQRSDVPPALETPSSEDNRKTVLLSEMPGASALAQEPAPPVPAAAAPAPPLSVAPDLNPAVLAAFGQRYDILGEAGHGSMGHVYKARDRETGETVALKILKPEIASDQAMMERFKNELLFARRITHKSVCRVHEFNRIGGIAYTSMEFVEGDSLRSVLNRFGGLTPRKAVDVALQICSGLKEAHAQGIVHRDLKPENIMMDAQGNVKIMDFGIARSMEAVTRLTGSMVGTPAYMAPEQVAGKPVDCRADIYSLGLMLYEIFTGTQAFQAENPVAVALKQLRESPPPPREIEPSVPLAADRAIMRCLEKDPSRRFQTIAELEAALRVPARPGAGSAVASAPTPAPRPIHTDIRTSPALLTHGGSLAASAEPKRGSPFTWVFFLALLAVSGYGGWNWVKAEQAEEKVPPAVVFPPPAPPDFALDPTADTGDASPETAPATPVDTAPNASAAPAVPAKSEEPAKVDAANAVPASALPAAAPASTAAAKPTTGASAKKSSQRSAPDSAPADVKQRADQAFSEAKSPAPANAAPAEAGPTYLWIGRFTQEDAAQTQSRKIEDLGLPVEVLPRHGSSGSQFFVVLAGPFGAKRVESVMDWLQTQGFSGVHPVRNPWAHQASNTSSNP